MNVDIRSLFSGSSTVPFINFLELEMGILSSSSIEFRDLSFLSKGAVVQIGEETGDRVFEVVWSSRDRVLLRNIKTGVETAHAHSDIWPVAPLVALAKVSE